MIAHWMSLISLAACVFALSVWWGTGLGELCVIGC